MYNDMQRSGAENCFNQENSFQVLDTNNGTSQKKRQLPQIPANEKNRKLHFELTSHRQPTKKEVQYIGASQPPYLSRPVHVLEQVRQPLQEQDHWYELLLQHVRHLVKSESDAS